MNAAKNIEVGGAVAAAVAVMLAVTSAAPRRDDMVQSRTSRDARSSRRSRQQRRPGEGRGSRRTIETDTNSVTGKRLPFSQTWVNTSTWSPGPARSSVRRS